MDLNMVVLNGRIAAPPEPVRQLDNGANFTRVLVAVTSTNPDRMDVLPVMVFASGEDSLTPLFEARIGSRIWISAKLQRRFWDTADGRRSKVEIVASDYSLSIKEDV